MIDDVVQLVITANSRTPTRQGFGNTLCVAYHAKNVDTYRVYTDLSGMLTDGFVSTERPYKMVAAAFNQNPRPPKVLLGRLPTQSTQSFTLTMLSAVQGDIVSIEVQDSAGVWSTLTYTVGASETTTTVATAFELLTEAVTGMDSTSSGAVVTATPTVATAPIAFRNPRNIALRSTSSDSGYATALGNVLAATTDFYFVTTDHNSQTIATAVSAWAQTNAREYVTQSNDTIEATGTGTFGSSLKALSYTYSAGIFCHDPTEYPAVAACALGAVRDPGSFTWNLKELIGITPVVLTASQQTNLDNEGWNYYVEVANGIKGITAKYGGLAAWGGRFVDLTHGTDALAARLKEGELGTLANAEKIDYDEPGFLVLRATALGVLRTFEDSKLLVKGSSDVFYQQKSAQSATDIGNRYYPGLSFASVYRGAVHRIKIVGTIAL